MAIVFYSPSGQVGLPHFFIDIIIQNVWTNLVVWLLFIVLYSLTAFSQLGLQKLFRDRGLLRAFFEFIITFWKEFVKERGEVFQVI